MSKPKTIEDCQNRPDFERWACDHGGEIKYSGRHPKAVSPSGAKIPLAGHGNETIPIGTRKSMIKMFIAAGLALLPLACLATILISGGM